MKHTHILVNIGDIVRNPILELQLYSFKLCDLLVVVVFIVFGQTGSLCPCKLHFPSCLSVKVIFWRGLKYPLCHTSDRYLFSKILDLKYSKQFPLPTQILLYEHPCIAIYMFSTNDLCAYLRVHTEIGRESEFCNFSLLAFSYEI